MSFIGDRIFVEARGGQGPRGGQGQDGNGANPFPPVSGETGVLFQSYMPGDIRRYGIFPGDGIDHEVVNPTRLAAFMAASCLPNVRGYIPRGTYSFGINFDSSHNDSRIWADKARLTGIYHLTDGVSDVEHLGEWLTEDRIGITGEGSARIRLGVMRALSGSRGVHIVHCPDLDFELLHVEDVEQCNGSGDQGNLAAVFIENQNYSGCRGRIQVDNSQSNGVFINGLDLDVDIEVRGYGGSAIDTGGAALEGLSDVQTELGAGVILHRWTGDARVNITQSNASPVADTFAMVIPETGVGGTESRHVSGRVSGYVTVGNGNRGICIGMAEGAANSAVANVDLQGLHARLRSAGTLASGYAGVNVVAPSATEDHYRRLAGRLEFSNFGAVQELKVSAVATSALRNLTELAIESLAIPEKGAGRAIQLVGNRATGGVLRGYIRGIAINSVGGSHADIPLTDTDGCNGLEVGYTSMTSANSINSMAARIANNLNCRFVFGPVHNYGQGDAGAIKIDGNTNCTFFGAGLTNASTVDTTGIRFFGTITGCTFQGFTVSGFATGFDAGAMTFTRCTAIGMTATGNTDDTDLTTSDFPAANQLGCTNFAV